MAGYDFFGDARNSPIAQSLPRSEAATNIRDNALMANVRSAAKDKKRVSMVRRQVAGDIANRAAGRTINAARAYPQARDRVTEEAFAAMAIAKRHQQVDFSDQQRQLQQMFGHGEKIWGTEMEPVKINNDLNPGKSDPWDETSSMFGAGPHSERSGLF